MQHFADRLLAAVRAKQNPLCVGLDPRWESLPLEIRKRHSRGNLLATAEAYAEFCKRILEIVAPLVPVVKPQSAFFEACGPDGMFVLQGVLAQARNLGLITILDAKRNDIASTATAYADAAFGGVRIEGKVLPVWDADALTINPYLGRDAVEPFIQSARRSGCGLFVLVRTSNPGAGLFQDLVCEGKTVCERVAEAVDSWSRENLGSSGYGDVGAVVGATHPAELARLRGVLRHSIVLIPGYGAQGGTAADVAPGFANNGIGAVVNSSRGVTFPFAPDAVDWEQAVERATRATIRELQQAVGISEGVGGGLQT